MADKKSLLIRIDGDSTSLRNEFKRIKTQTQGLQDNLSSIAKKSAVAFAGLTATVVGLTKSYRTQEQAQIRTNQTLEATGFAAGITADELFNMASELQKVTTFGDEAILSGQNLLLTFRNIGKDTFPRATEAMLDMSTAMGTGLKESAIQLGKALNDPIAGISSLTRVGITFTDAQKEQIRLYQQSGQLAQAQAIILKELEMQFGGVSKAAAKGTGVFIQLNNSLGDVFEKIGKNVTKTLEPFVRKLKEIIDRVNESNPVFFEYASNIVLGITAVTGLVAVLATLGVGLITTKAAVAALGISFSATWAAATLGLSLVATGVVVLVKELGGVEATLTTIQAGFTLFVSKAIQGFNATRIATNNLLIKMKELGVATLEALPSDRFNQKIKSMKANIAEIEESNERLIQQNKLVGESFSEIVERIDAEKAAEKTRLQEEAIAKERDIARELELEKRTEQDEADAGYREQKRQQIREEMEAAFQTDLAIAQAQNALFQLERDKASNLEKLKLKQKIRELQKIRDKGLSEEKKQYFKNLDEQREAFKEDKKQRLDFQKNFNQSTIDSTINLGKKVLGESTLAHKALLLVEKRAALKSAIMTTAKAVNLALGSAPPPISYALAAAAGAFGAIQIADIASTAIQGFNQGGVVGSPVGGMNQDRYPALLADGELVVPKKNFDEVITATANARGMTNTGSTNQVAKVEISFTDDAAEFITARQLENSTLGTDRA